MGQHLPVLSGEELVRHLERHGFVRDRHVGSHATLERGTESITIPMHKELRKGTLSAILKSTALSIDEVRNPKLRATLRMKL